MKNNRHITPIFLITTTIGIIAFYIISAIFYPKLYIFGTYEDLYGEWAQTFFFLATFIFALLNAINKNQTYRWFFSLLAIASFYVFMEEISWGQRLIGFDTPGYFHRNSYQDEANLHNLLTGPVKVWTKTVLTYLISCGLVGYGILYPLCLNIEFKPAMKLAEWGVPPPPMALMLAFLLAAILELEPFGFNEAEIAELLVALALTFTALHYYLQVSRGQKTADFMPHLGLFQWW